MNKEMLKPYFAEWQTEVDITVVLKYIDSKAIIEWNASVEVYENTEDWYYIGNILLKPLNLYTEQEEISLLNLLLKLK